MYKEHIVITPFTLESVWLYHCLKKEFSLIAFVDSDEKFIGQQYCGIPIVNSTPDITAKHVIALLPNIYSTDGGGLAKVKRLSYLNSINIADDSALVINTVDAFLTEKCTLRCDGCVDLMQYFKNPCHMEVADIIRDFNKLISSVDFINYIHILGGEPFLYPDLYEILLFFIKSEEVKRKVGYVNIVTNGTIVPCDEILDLLSESNVGVYISDYGKLSRNIDKLQVVLEEKRIRYIRMFQKKWAYVGQYRENPVKDEVELEIQFQKCNHRKVGCKFVREGKFYYCPFICNGEALGLFPYSDANSVDLLNEEKLRERISTYMDGRNAVPACAWCSGYSEEDLNNEIPVAVQRNKPKEYVGYKRG